MRRARRSRRLRRLDPLDFVTRLGRRAVAIQQNRWTDAETVTEELAKSEGPFERFLEPERRGHARRGARTRAGVARNLGSGSGAAGLRTAYGRDPESPVPVAAPARPSHAMALEQAELALVDARNRDQEFETLQLLAIAQAAVGRKADSDKTLARARVAREDHSRAAGNSDECIGRAAKSLCSVVTRTPRSQSS